MLLGFNDTRGEKQNSIACAFKVLSHSNMNYLIEKVNTHSIMEFYKNCLLKNFPKRPEGCGGGMEAGYELE